MKRLPRIVSLLLTSLITTTATAEPQQAAEEPPAPSVEVHFRVQGWYQLVEDGAPAGGDDLNDFLLRRAYLSLAGHATPKIGFFAHLATDRLGQEGLDVPSLGLGSGLAVRDGWIVFDLAEPFKVQVGRMYPPFTRAFGTESTFSLLTLDIPFTQGGIRGTTFYPGKVGRDDGVVVWGNVAGKWLQYRLGFAEGVEGAANPSDALRLSGRLAFSLFEPETSWFNRGTYLGSRKVLSLGLGFDQQPNLTLAGRPSEDYSAWTMDLFLDYPIRQGAWTVEAAYMESRDTPKAVSFTHLASDDDHRVAYLQASYLLPQ